MKIMELIKTVIRGRIDYKNNSYSNPCPNDGKVYYDKGGKVFTK